MASARWQRRNARARALGYKNYYDYRAHDNGRIAPAAPRLKGEALARSRGHRSRHDLDRMLASGRVELVLVNIATRDPETGEVTAIEVQVTTADGRMHSFRLRGRQVSPDNLDRLRDAIADSGAGRVSAYALKLLTREDEEDEDDLEGEYAEDDSDIPF